MEKILKSLKFVLAVHAVIAALAAGCVKADGSVPVAGDSAAGKKYCISVLPAPVLNTRDFHLVFGGEDGKTVKVDDEGLLRELEFIALPGTVFEIDAAYSYDGREILRVRTSDYPYSGTELYIDSRFVIFKTERPPEREKNMPSEDQILQNLISMEGAPYLWGGNFCGGIEEMIKFYKPEGGIDEKTRSLWNLEGVDCSGLLYQASNGCTPRNTSSLVRFGEGVRISGMTKEGISSVVEPLDIMVWIGHVIIVIDRETVIESAYGRGVALSPLMERLDSLMKDRKPVDDWDASEGKRFLLRRWHQD